MESIFPLFGPNNPRSEWAQSTAVNNDEAEWRGPVDLFYYRGPFGPPLELNDVRAIFREHNAERRRRLLRGIGMARLFREVGGTVRHQDIDGHGNPRRLLAIELPDDDPEYTDPDSTIVVVHVIDPSTRDEYFLRVPPNTQTCQQAVAWTFGFEWRPDRYKPNHEA